ncbi:MAG: translation elongation factor Ts [candidate division WWE3 bacterium]|nr:translation elongation factor Ts [candidate division WWE3 bacterium]
MNLELLKKLREETAAGVMDCRQALDESGDDYAKALESLRQKGVLKAASKESREVKAGVVASYIHSGDRIGSLVAVACETDFVARIDEFKELAHEIAMQVAAMNPASVEELLEQPFIRDSSKTIKDLIIAVVAKTRENIKIVEFSRFQV